MATVILKAIGQAGAINLSHRKAISSHLPAVLGKKACNTLTINYLCIMAHFACPIIYIYIYCESSSCNIQAQHQSLATKETASPVALIHGKPGVASILFSQSAILNGEGAILCENTGGGSEHGTDPVAPPVTSSNRRFNERAPVAETRSPRHPAQSAAATYFRGIAAFFSRKGGYKVERETLVSSFSCLSPALLLVYSLDQV